MALSRPDFLTALLGARAASAGLRYLTADTMPAMFQLTPTCAKPPVELNRLNNQILVHYHEEE